MDAEKKVKRFIEKQNLIEKGDRVLLGLSGGADSVCLFYLLLGLREELGFELRAAHVHHGIRAEAEKDALYVEELCRQEGIRCCIFREDIPAYAAKQGVGEEEAGRILRYADFETCLRLWEEEDSGQDCRPKTPFRYKIATAHHENDQAETVLFQLFRGCGLAGLRGILPARDHIIRPLLCLSRGEIERHLQDRGISWCEDRTNQTEDYSRNKIRRRILSYAEHELNCSAAAHIAKTAEMVREAEHYIRRQTEETYGRIVKEREGLVVFDIPSLQKEDVFLQKQLLLYGLERLSAKRKDIGAVHVEDILKLLEKQGTGGLFLPAGIRVRKYYQKLALFREEGEEAETGGGIGNREKQLSVLLAEERGFLCGKEKPVVETERIDLARGSVKERFGTGEISEIPHCIPQKIYTKWFDYDKIKMPFSVRHPENGDYLTIDGAMNRKSFKRYMIEDKVPASLRSSIWILAADSHVIWVPGGRISAYYKATAQTKTILQVKICREE